MPTRAHFSSSFCETSSAFARRTLAQAYAECGELELVPNWEYPSRVAWRRRPGSWRTGFNTGASGVLIGVDPSKNLWTGSSDQPVTELPGLATPTAAPFYGERRGDVCHADEGHSQRAGCCAEKEISEQGLGKKAVEEIAL